MWSLWVSGEFKSHSYLWWDEQQQKRLFLKPLRSPLSLFFLRSGLKQRYKKDAPKWRCSIDLQSWRRYLNYFTPWTVINTLTQRATINASASNAGYGNFIANKSSLATCIALHYIQSTVFSAQHKRKLKYSNRKKCNKNIKIINIHNLT